MSDRVLKAYEVRDSGEGYCVIQFATNSAAARREGAGELGTDFESVESCVRKPEFDAYAPGPVPPLVLIEHGWWFECHHCGRQVSNDMADDLDADGLDPDDFVPRAASRRSVFCSAACEAMEAAEQRANTAAVAALLEVFEAKFPGASVCSAYVHGGRLEKSDVHRGAKSSVSFTFPGGEDSASWNFGEDLAWVSMRDREAFLAWMLPHRPTATANWPCGSMGEEVCHA